MKLSRRMKKEYDENQTSDVSWKRREDRHGDGPKRLKGEQWGRSSRRNIWDHGRALGHLWVLRRVMSCPAMKSFESHSRANLVIWQAHLPWECLWWVCGGLSLLQPVGYILSGPWTRYSFTYVESIPYARHGPIDKNKTNHAPVSIKLMFYWWRYKIST